MKFMSKIKNKKDITLEDAFGQLSKIVNKIESENISLERTIELFEEGVLLTDLCQKKLNTAEKKVKSLLEKNNLT